MTVSTPTPTAPTRPRLKTTVDVVDAEDGNVYLLRPGAPCDLCLEQPDAEMRELLERLDGRHTLAELAPDAESEQGERRIDAIEQLTELGLLEDGADDERLDPQDLARYDRQLAYFSELLDDGESRAACQARLREARVVILGLGGLGSWAAWALASCGIGRIDGVDGDLVELSNLNRQVLYRQSDIGRPKAVAAGETLCAFDERLDYRAVPHTLDGPEAVERAVRGASFVLECADWPPLELSQWVNAACLEHGIPHISASQFPPHVRVGPTYLPGRTACVQCEHEHYRASHPLFDQVAAAQRGQRSNAATFGPACGLIGSLIANDVVNHLTGLAEPATAARALMIDLRTLEVTDAPLPSRDPDCSACGNLVGTPA